jgi:hypothetical protein
MITDEQVEAALSATDFCINAATMKWMRAALEASERAAWRPVSEMKEQTISDDAVLSFRQGGNQQCVSQLLDDGWWCVDGGKLLNVTHFRPLPTPPHEG